jgi:hypothetical protein
MSVITVIFDKTAHVLQRMAQMLNLTYNQVNIIVYYMVVPCSWLIMLDFIIGCWPLTTVLWIVTCLIVWWCNRRDFSRWFDEMFRKSVDFLLWFRRIGWSYYKASVIICVAVPLLIYLGLIFCLAF